MNEENPEPSYYAIIEADVRYDNDLKPNEKLLYAEITALSEKEGYCWAGNKYFADLFDVTKETVSRWIGNLKDKGYINREIYRGKDKQIEKRVITPIDKKINTSPQNNQQGIDKKIKENDTRINTTSNNDKPSDKSDTDQFSIEKMENGRYNYPDGYEEVYSAYPDNNGTKKAGWRKWAARRREGISNEKLLAAALNYAKECQREDRDKKYVKHIATFFGPDEHWKQYFSLKEVDDSERSSGDDQESNGEGSKDEGSRLQEKAFELMGLS